MVQQIEKTARKYYVASWPYGRASNPDGSPCREIYAYNTPQEAQAYVDEWNGWNGRLVERVLRRDLMSHELGRLFWEPDANCWCSLTAYPYR